MKNLKHIALNKNILALFVSFFASSAFASKATFDYQATYQRNKSIWGTYKLKKEGLSVKRGKLSWKKFPEGRVGDIILSKGNFILLRETVVDSETKIVVDKVPYKKIGKNTYINRSPLNKEVFDRLFQTDIQGGVPHLDLRQGKIEYQTIKCRKKRGSLKCAVKGEINP